MGERQVTVDGKTRAAAPPFLVLATQNPIEYEGTFPLPEAQLDRFLFKLRLGYLAPGEESAMLVNLGGRHPIEALAPIVDGAAVPHLAEQVWTVRVDDGAHVYHRPCTGHAVHADLALGASPRGSLALYRSAQACAAMDGRTYVLPDDVQALAPLALPHRCILRPESTLRGRTPVEIVAEIVAKTPLPLGTVER